MGVPRIVKILGAGSLGLFLYANIDTLYGNAPTLAPAPRLAQGSFSTDDTFASSSVQVKPADTVLPTTAVSTGGGQPTRSISTAQPVRADHAATGLRLQLDAVAESSRTGRLMPSCFPSVTWSTTATHVGRCSGAGSSGDKLAVAADGAAGQCTSP